MSQTFRRLTTGARRILESGLTKPVGGNDLRSPAPSLSRGWKNWTHYDDYVTNVRQQQERIMHKNRPIAPLEPARHRSEWPNWNYDAEIYAFAKRIGEEFDDALLRRAFCDASFVIQSSMRQAKLGIGGGSVGVDDTTGSYEANDDLVDLGRKLADEYIQICLKSQFPNLPQEGADAASSYLLSELISAHIARNIGVTDLILCDRIKPKPRTLAKTFHAVIGALALSSDVQRAHEFVLDFILPQLVEKDIFELMEEASLPLDLDLLSRIYSTSCGAVLEPRLIRSTGSETILSLYTVGIYSDKHLFDTPSDSSTQSEEDVMILVGSGSGETVSTAVDMAAKDGLRRVFGLHWGARMAFGQEARRLRMEEGQSRWSIAELL